MPRSAAELFDLPCLHVGDEQAADKPLIRLRGAKFEPSSVPCHQNAAGSAARLHENAGEGQVGGRRGVEDRGAPSSRGAGKPTRDAKTMRVPSGDQENRKASIAYPTILVVGYGSTPPGRFVNCSVRLLLKFQVQTCMPPERME